jgi:putative DNA primase/helicase
MGASNYDDVLGQLLDAGLIIPPGDGLRINSHKPVRVFTQDGGREKRGWYLLKEWSPSADRLLIVGAYGVWRGNDQNGQKVALPKDDTGRVTAEQRDAMKRVWADAAKAAELQRKKEAQAAADVASKAWSRLLPDGDSPYLRAKSVLGYGLKFTKHHTAVLPLTDTGGRIHGLQFLRTPAQAKEGKRPVKEFWPAGVAKKGHFHLLGHQPHWIVLVAEGYATAASLHAATGYPVVCAFDAGNLKPVAEALRTRYKQAKILICADDDCFTEGNPGVASASAAAMAVAGEWVKPVFADEAGRHAKHEANGTKLTDFNDLHAAEGLGAVGAVVTARLLELRWGPPALRAVSSSKPGDRGGKLRPMQYVDDLLQRYALVYAGNGAAFDHQEHLLLPLTDVRNACVRPDLYKAWAEHSDRQIVRQAEVGFDPAEEDEAVTCNLWGGWPSEPESGKCELILDLLQYMCSGERNSRELYEWILKWCAYPIQNPGAKMKSTVVVHGGQGLGKNLFFEGIMGIYGQYGRILDQDALVDKHNDWASRKLFLIADEVVASAHRFEHKNKLKTLITGTQIRINPKHIAAYDEANHCNLVFLSNESMPVVLEEDDRRHCVLWMADPKDEEYYKAVAAQMKGGGIAALHHFLLHLDLGDFNPHTKPPSSDAKRELIDLAQDSPIDFLTALLEDDLPPLRAQPGLVLDWFKVYQRWCANVGIKPASLKRFSDTLKRRRKLVSTRKGYLRGQSITNPAAVYLFGKHAPEGAVESHWLGDEIQAMRHSMQDYLGGNHSGDDGYGGIP